MPHNALNAKAVTPVHSVALGLLVVLTLSACEEDFTAVLGTDRPYSLFGVLSPQLDSQWVRVYPIEGRLEPENSPQLDAHFVSTDLQTGEEFVWRDSVIVDVFGQLAHVFWAPFAADYDHSYLLTVRRSDGVETRVSVSVPPRTEVVIQEADIGPISVTVPVLIAGDTPRVLRVEVEYAVGYRPAGDANPTTGVVSIPYVDEPFATQDGWIVPIHLESDFHAVSDTLARRIQRPIDRDFGVMLNTMTLHLIVVNEEWNPPGGTFDANILVQPGTLSNVTNGFGFVGAGYRHETTWVPEASVLRAAGFRADAD